MGKHEITNQAVMAALSKVQEPELHRDLVTLNMIRDVKIDGDNVSLTVMLTTPACPLRSQIEREVREAVAAIPGVASVQVKLDANVPTDGRARGSAGASHSQCHRSRVSAREASGGKAQSRLTWLWSLHKAVQRLAC